jgi:hypothetical protein
VTERSPESEYLLVNIVARPTKRYLLCELLQDNEYTDITRVNVVVTVT